MKNMIQRFIILIIASLTVLSAKAQGATTLEGGNDYANTGYEVGEIPIQYALTPTGAVTYRWQSIFIPIRKTFTPVCRSVTIANNVKAHWGMGGISVGSPVSPTWLEQSIMMENHLLSL